MRTGFLVLMLACAWPAWGQANATITGATIAGGVTIGIGAGAAGIQSWQFGVHANTASNLSRALTTMGATASRNWRLHDQRGGRTEGSGLQLHAGWEDVQGSVGPERYGRDVLHGGFQQVRGPGRESERSFRRGGNQQATRVAEPVM